MIESRLFISESTEDTERLAGMIAGLLGPNDLLTLEGDLGAGKTTFTKALAACLGVRETVNSPTFTIMKEYAGRLPFYHMDAYRIESEEEEFGLDEYFQSGGVTVIEWASRISDQLPEERFDLVLTYTGPDSREIELTARGKRCTERLKEITET
ncbi:tRNA (adenosine(37)-N6)-threonylcarbamoyltransferase complex ATPase subunit type 1 TsaE [Salisediminibacterium halotolerans]|uniref:tRNA threonylcarbamoyladenosine biosynthesis protein TsaE n=1 Tax=Salisediminibacterium halotolerans TaxID=517425 RepID=A0A1H9TC50_9BACI|nr:tRNA (adenosine(37)-N6)-threonylcarbamoyltransferase complex ATPase subunit type 1 TsaE [Salisediminibacterium haloalkalitolerans]SER94900.1 tRNA threonylcarbamoyladenosine biosynthesis protein TsaE [Salisediminibacterium haloalkalitolerans]